MSECTSTNTFRMGSKNSPFATKSRACATVRFMARIISWCADSTRTTAVCCTRGADKFLARPGRKQATATEEFEFHISCL